MASSLEVKSMALDYVRQVQTKLSDNGRQTYDEFCHILKQFRRRNVHPSTVVSTVEKLFHNHPDLIHAFKPFMPTNYPATTTAAAVEESDLRVCVDFLKRVGTQFNGNGIYSKFLDCMKSYSRGESTVFEVCDNVVKLFGEDKDLVAEFMCFLPESSIQERCKKRKIGFDHTYNEQEFSLQPPTKKRNSNDSNHSKHVDDETLGAQRRSSRRRSINLQEGEEKADEEISASPPRNKQKRLISSNEKIDFDMEESLFEVDVQIGNVISTYKNALRLTRRLCWGRLSPANVRLHKHFTPLNLACIRKLHRKFLDNVEHRRSAVLELMSILMKKKVALEKSRLKIEERWIKSRQSRN